MNLKKNMIFGISCGLLFVGGTSLSATTDQMQDEKAANNRDYFAFTISGKNDRYDNYRYRSTTDASRPWGVGLDSSGEGTSTYTTFWMEKDGGTHTAAAHNVQVKHKSVTAPYPNANQIKNRLTAQDNDSGSGEYKVTGGWDEECNKDW